MTPSRTDDVIRTSPIAAMHIEKMKGAGWKLVTVEEAKTYPGNQICESGTGRVWVRASASAPSSSGTEKGSKKGKSFGKGGKKREREAGDFEQQAATDADTAAETRGFSR